jgi:membrane-associated protein
MNMFDVKHIIESGGLLVISLIVFAESGLLIGFFLPGDTLLFTAGFFASQGQLHIGVLLITIILSAIIGDNVGYQIGKRTGPKIFTKKDGIIFRKEYIENAEAFYQKHGGKTIILARFVPVVRTFAPVVAGVGNMDRRKFIIFNIIGGASWGASITLLGFWLGSRINNIEAYIMPVFLFAILITWAPAFYHLLKEPRTRRALKKSMMKKFRKQPKED